MIFIEPTHIKVCVKDTSIKHMAPDWEIDIICIYILRKRWNYESDVSVQKNHFLG